MAPSDDPADAAARLESALERISMLAQQRPQPAGPSDAGSPAVTGSDDALGRKIGGRLDQLIEQLRGALDGAG